MYVPMCSLDSLGDLNDDHRGRIELGLNQLLKFCCQRDINIGWLFHQLKLLVELFMKFEGLLL